MYALVEVPLLLQRPRYTNIAASNDTDKVHWQDVCMFLGAKPHDYDGLHRMISSLRPCSLILSAPKAWQVLPPVGVNVADALTTYAASYHSSLSALCGAGD